MAFINAPADDRMEKLGSKLSNSAGFIANQMFKNNNQTQRQQFMQDQAKLQDELAMKRWMEQQQYKEGLVNSMFGQKAMGSTAENPVFLEGSMNQQNTGLTPQVLNQLKMQAMTGVKAPSLSGQRPSYAYKGGNIYANGQKVGTYPLTPREQGKGSGGSPSRLGKLMSEMKSYDVNSPQYKAYVETINKLASQGDSDAIIMARILMGEDANTPQQTTDKFGFVPKQPQVKQQGSSVQNFMNR